MELVTAIYKVTEIYPKEETYTLTSQTKRTAVSVPANIAEGIGRQYKKDIIQFLDTVRGSLYELETLLLIAVPIQLLPDDKFNDTNKILEKTLQVLNGLINYYEKVHLKITNNGQPLCSPQPKY